MKQMKKNVILAISLSIATFGIYAQEKTKSMDELWGESTKVNTKYANTERGDWFSQDKYSLFIHWGLFSIPAGEWKGKTYYGISEWLMTDFLAGISVDEYKKLANEFNPKAFDAKAWVQLAVDAGMKNIVITAKHHEGFAMYHSKSHDFDIEDATSFTQDPLKALAQECEKAGIGLGFYYSQNQDWYEQGSADIPWQSSKQKNDFTDYFNQKVIPQVTELLTEYGPIRTVWFDTPGNMTKTQSLALVKLVRKLQPKAMINSRIGNGVGDFETLGDHSISQINHKGLWETIDTTNDSWAYAWYDRNWKSPTEIAHRLITTVGRGGNYMLNVGPDKNGVIPAIPAQSLRDTGKWLKDYGQTIYGAQGSPWKRAQAWGDVTYNNGQLFLHVFNWPTNGKLHLSGLENDILSAQILNFKNSPVGYEKEDSGWTVLTLPRVQPDALVPVISLKLKGAPKVDETIGIDPEITTTLNAAFANCDNCEKKELRWMQKFGEWKYADSLVNWTAKSTGTWEVDVSETGQYLLQVEYSANDKVDFSEWRFQFQNEQLLMQALDTGERLNSLRQFPGRTLYRYRKDDVGIVELEQGKQTILVSPKSDVINGGINLKAIHLVPVR
jgi:alpha-L-fucosidase